MTEKTEELLQGLADKLGTTIEHLWGVLIAQAKVDIAVSVIQLICMIIFIVITTKLHLKFSKTTGEKYDSTSIYSKYEIAALLPMIIAGILSAIFIVLILNGFNDLFAAIFNPEYWALKRIIHLH